MKISVDVKEEIIEKKKKLNLKWNNLIESGLRYHQLEVQNIVLSNDIRDWERKYQDLEEEYKRRGIRLQKYLEKYGLDEEIMYSKF